MSCVGGGGTSAVDELVTEFSSIAGVDFDRARFYLESAGWDLNLALSSFFEEVSPPESPSELLGDDVPGVSSEDGAEALATAAARVPVKYSQRKMDRQIRTFRDLNNASASSDSEEEGQRFFTGGSEHSGQQVLGPPGKKKILANEVVQSIFEQARAHGATAADQEPRSATRSAFTGTGFRLGADNTQQQSSATGQNATTARASPTSVEISLWHDGFTVDNGPLRRYDTPEGKEFLECVKH
ncbi:NSFL1 cofactor p47-like, partial [Tropilaelaps mercedesae]